MLLSLSTTFYFQPYYSLLAANSTDLKSSRVSLSINENIGVVGIKSSADRADISSSLMPKGRHHSEDVINYSKNGTGNMPLSDKSSVRPAALTIKGRHDAIDESSSSKNGNARVTCSNTEYKPENWMLPGQAEDTLNQLNLAIVSQP